MHKTTHPCGGTHPPQFQTPPNRKIDAAILPPYQRHDPHRNRHTDAVSLPFTMTSLAARASSWLRSRRIRCLFLLLFSPLILGLIVVFFPFLCAAELWLRRRRKRLGDAGGDRLRRCEEGCCDGEGQEEKGLLHRYLEDQLLLVRSMYDCGDDEEHEEDSRRVEDPEIPLLR